MAGAGSGKTMTLTTKIAYLIKEKNFAPQNILALTFTNKAAKEMAERVGKILKEHHPQTVQAPLCTTFHSFCALFLRKEIERLKPYKRSFVIYDSSDQLKLIGDIIKEKKIDPKTFTPRSVQSRISNYKNKLFTADDVAAQNNFWAETIGTVWQQYQQKLEDANAVDFDDLLLLTVKILKQFPEVKTKYQNIYKYLLIDEYQDTNEVQYQIAKMLCENNHLITVVGDDDQSIYKFRGAEVKNIRQFHKHLPHTQTIKLEENYRSTQNILNLAYDVIKESPTRQEKKLWTNGEVGEKIQLKECLNETSEAEYIANEIEKLQITKDNFKFSDVAILYRVNALSRNLEDALLSHQIPYKIVGGLRFYDRKEVKDVISYLRVIFNPSDDITLERVINTPARGIGATTLQKLKTNNTHKESIKETTIDNQQMGLFDHIEIKKSFELGNSLFSKFEQINNFETISPSTRQRIADFVKQLKKWQEFAQNNSVFELLKRVIIDTKYQEYLTSEFGKENGEERFLNIEELFNLSSKYQDNGSHWQSLEIFLEEISLIADIGNKQNDDDAITLMTIHAAKGLEFPYVFLAGLEEEIFPSYRSMGDAEDLDEERRLMYVAITRAEKRLYISHCKNRLLHGRSKYFLKSRFLNNLNDEYLETNSQDPERTRFSDEHDDDDSGFKFFKGFNVDLR